MKNKFMRAFMAKKKLFVMIAALCCAVGLWAECPENFTDKVNATQYLTDIQLDTETGVLTFTDNFLADQELIRDYSVYFFRPNGTCPFYYDSEYGYEYGQYNQFMILNDITSNSFCHCTGGERTYYIKSIVNKVKARGYSTVYMAIQPVYYMTDPISKAMFGKSYYYNEDPNSEKHLWLVNGVYVTFPTVSNLGITLPDNAHFEQDMNVRVDMTCMNRCSYILSWSTAGTSWGFIESAVIEADEAKNGAFRNITFRPTSKNVKQLYFRLEVWDLETGYQQTFTTEKPLSILYPLNNGGITWHAKGEKVEIPYEDCKAVQISAYLPTSVEHKADKVIFTMPACSVSVTQIAAKYTVKFYNADYSLLKTQIVNCGEDATAPSNPHLGGYTFTGWDKEFTNVQKDLKVFAKYDLDGDYYLMPWLEEHKNEMYPFDYFVGSETRAMVGDVLKFKIGMLAFADAALYYQTAQWNNSQQEWIWGDGKKIADYEYVPANPERTFDSPDIQVCYDVYNGIHAFENRLAIRFYMIIAGEKVYGDPFEFDVYYPTGIKTSTAAGVLAENNAGDFNAGTPIMLPARHNDTVWVYGMNGSGGGCFSYERVIKSSMPVTDGVDGEGNAFFIAPGELDTIVVSVTQTAVVFDGAEPLQTFDFTAQGLGKHTNSYYAEIVECGGAIAHMPEDPKSDGYTFAGWKSWDDTEYPDDAYLQVPAGRTFIGFTAQWDAIPQVQKYTVRFYGKDGDPLLDTQTIDEGQNATPPAIPAVAGWHFVKWDKPYTTITANTDITAIYGEDSKVWTITYYDEDGTTKLSEEQVADKNPANGLKIYREGYIFKHWYDIDKNAVADFSSITANMNVKAVFEVDPSVHYYKVTLVAEHGKISVTETDVDLTKVKENTVLHFTAKADNGYQFKSWNGYDPETGLKVTQDCTVTALFEEKPEQGLEDVQGNKGQCTKVIIDGKLYILRGENVYDAQGILIK